MLKGSTAELWQALNEVQDPEFLIGIVDMGLIVDVEQRGAQVTVKLTFTAMGCPATDMIMDDVRDKLTQVPGVEAVNIEVVWSPVWSKQRLTDDGKQQLIEMGIAV